VVFARGREELPGPGYVGNAFVNALRPKLPKMAIASYGVDYPADISPATGADDMSAHIQSMARSCPKTRMVLGGYSLGAAAADLVVAVTKPAFGFTNPLPPAMDDHIAAVALFGNGTRRILGPLHNFSPAFAGKL
jgi:cutinase